MRGKVFTVTRERKYSGHLEESRAEKIESRLDMGPWERVMAIER